MFTYPEWPHITVEIVPAEEGPPVLKISCSKWNVWYTLGVEDVLTPDEFELLKKYAAKKLGRGVRTVGGARIAESRRGFKGHLTVSRDVWLLNAKHEMKL